MDNIANDMAVARERLGLSQAEAAGRAGATQAHVSRLERGLVDPRLSSVVELARALELELRLVPRSLIPVVDAVLAGESAGNTEALLYAPRDGMDAEP